MMNQKQKRIYGKNNPFPVSYNQLSKILNSNIRVYKTKGGFLISTWNPRSASQNATVTLYHGCGCSYGHNSTSKKKVGRIFVPFSAINSKKKFIVFLKTFR